MSADVGALGRWVVVLLVLDGLVGLLVYLVASFMFGVLTPGIVR
jgi:hypothetical protein